MDSQLRIERIRAYGDRYNALGDSDVADILHTLRRLIKDDKLVSQCLDFIPMRLVTLIEVKLKGFIILLIDSISSPE